MADNPRQILEATESFICELDGERYVVNAGTTRIAASHPLAKAHSGNFQPVEDGLSYREEDTSDEPGRRRETSRREKTSTSDKEGQNG